MDEVAFLFSANKNEALSPVAQTASFCVRALVERRKDEEEGDCTDP